MKKIFGLCFIAMVTLACNNEKSLEQLESVDFKSKSSASEANFNDSINEVMVNEYNEYFKNVPEVDTVLLNEIINNPTNTSNKSRSNIKGSVPFGPSWWIEETVKWGLKSIFDYAFIQKSGEASLSVQEITKMLDNAVDKIIIKIGDTEMNNAEIAMLRVTTTPEQTRMKYQAAIACYKRALANYLTAHPYSINQTMTCAFMIEQAYRKLSINQGMIAYYRNMTAAYNIYRYVWMKHKIKSQSWNLTYNYMDVELRKANSSANNWYELMEEKIHFWRVVPGRGYRILPPQNQWVRIPSMRCVYGRIVSPYAGDYWWTPNPHNKEVFMKIYQIDGNFGIYFDSKLTSNYHYRLQTDETSYSEPNGQTRTFTRLSGDFVHNSVNSLQYRWRIIPYDDDLYAIYDSESGRRVGRAPNGFWKLVDDWKLDKLGYDIRPSTFRFYNSGGEMVK